MFLAQLRTGFFSEKKQETLKKNPVFKRKELRQHQNIFSSFSKLCQQHVAALAVAFIGAKWVTVGLGKALRWVEQKHHEGQTRTGDLNFKASKIGFLKGTLSLSPKKNSGSKPDQGSFARSVWSVIAWGVLFGLNRYPIKSAFRRPYIPYDKQMELRV